MSVITLTSDLGTKDYYAAAIKGAILSQLPDVSIVDITHEIPAFDYIKAAIIIRNCYNEFPKGTVHIVGVNTESNLETAHIAIFENGHYFVGADNGIFSLIFDKIPEKIVALNLNQDTDTVTFPTRDVFVKAACHLARGGTLEMIGKIKETIEVKTMFRAISENNSIKGMVAYIDHYGNLISNISESMFKSYGKGRNFYIFLRNSSYKISEILIAYNQVSEGEKLALFSSSGFIEIAVNRGNASKLMGLKETDLIRIEFYD